MKKQPRCRLSVALATIWLLAQLPFFGPFAHADGVSTTTNNADSSSESTSSGGQKAPNVETREPISNVTPEDDDAPGKFSGTYFGIFYGPNVTKPTSYQSNGDGVPEADKPVMMKNFVALGYNIAEHIRISPTAYWQWLPTGGGAYTVRDPFITLSDDAIISTGGWNLYGDVRYYAPFSSWSKAQDIQGSVQSVQVLTYVPNGSRFMFATYSSEREYLYGANGFGDDLELYLGPNINYQLSPTVQLTMLYELNLAHVYQTNPDLMYNYDEDIEPGVSWDINDHLNLHPYLNLYPQDLSFNNIGVGMLLYWQAF